MNPRNLPLPDALAVAQAELRSRGWSIITDAGFSRGGAVDVDAVRRLAEYFGRPSDRDGGQDVWPVRPRTTDPAATFSQRAGAALLHTDAAYRADPEPLFALFCAQPAADGGLSRLLAAADAVRDLDPAVAEQLRRPVWRWAPPSVFGGSPDTARPVLGPDGGLRWRPDNLTVAADLAQTAAAFTAHVESHPCLVQLPLPADTVLVCDNSRVLHGRTAFADQRRLLLRVRLVTR